MSEAAQLTVLLSEIERSLQVLGRIERCYDYTTSKRRPWILRTVPARTPSWWRIKLRAAAEAQ